MRVLLSTIGSRGDVQPLVALALALRELGQDVRLCVPPDFREWIEGLGFAVTPIGPELRTFAAARPASAAPPSPMTAEQRRQLAEALGRRAVHDGRRGGGGLRRHRRGHGAPDRRALRGGAAGHSRTSSPPTVRSSFRRRTTRRRRCRRCRGKPSTRRRPTTRRCGRATRSASTICSARRSTPTARRSGSRRSTTCGATSSATGRGSPRIASLAPWPDPAEGSRVPDRRVDRAGRASARGGHRGLPRRGRAADLLRVRQHPRRAGPRRGDAADGARARPPRDRVPRLGRPDARRCARLPGDRRSQPAGACSPASPPWSTTAARAPPRSPRSPARRRSSSRRSTTSTISRGGCRTWASARRMRPAHRPRRR